MEAVGVLVGVVCLLALLALLGHGIWLLGAWFISNAFGPPPVSTGWVQQPAACPRCGLPLESPRCAACDWPLPRAAPISRPEVALGAVEKQVERLSRLGVLDPAIGQSLSRAFSDERQRLAEARRAAAAAAAAPVAAVAPPTAPRSEPPIEPEIASPAPLAAQLVQAEPSPRPQPVESVPALPLPPRGTWLDWLAAFMEERNMRWGEMIGGLLIVCCSIALVVSFWSAIAERAWLKFFLFGGVTAALFGIGFQSVYRWRLHTTGQGMLIIASMLVPLNFLAIAAFSASAAVPLTLAGEMLSVLVFTALVYWAGQVLVDRAAPWLTAGVMVPSLAQLLVRRYVDPAAGLELLVVLAALPVACYLVVNGRALARIAAVLVPSEAEINALLKFSGLTSFAVLPPLALLLFKTDDPLETLRGLTPLVGLLALGPLSVGLSLWQKLAGGSLAGLRTAGTSLAVFGALLSLAGVALGWPEPRAMLPSALVEFAIFTFVAWRFDLPAAHLVAAAMLAVGYLLAANLLDGQIAWAAADPAALARVMFSGPTAALLAPLVVGYAAAWYASLRVGYRGAAALAWATAALAAVSAALASWFGFGVEGDPSGAGWIYLLYAAGCLVVAARSSRQVFPWIAAGLLLAGVVQEVMFHYGARWHLDQPQITAIMLFCTLAVAIAVLVQGARLAIADSPLNDVLWNAAFFGSLAAAGWLVWIIPSQSAAFEGGHWFWIAALWAAIATATAWPWLWMLVQLAVSLGTVFTVAAQLEKQPWFAESRRPWLDPWTLEAIGIALAGLNLGWSALRIAGRAIGADRAPQSAAARARELVVSPWLALDRPTSAALAALVVVLASYAAMPGVMQELSPRVPVAGVVAAAGEAAATPARIVPPVANFEWLGIPHQHAPGWGAWLLVASVLVLLAALLRESRSPLWLWCMIVVAAAVCPLLASHWEDEVATASALRWLSAGFLLAGSAPIWARAWVARQAERLGWQVVAPSENLPAEACGLVFLLGLFAPLAMAAGIAVTAVSPAPHASGSWFPWLAVWGATLVWIAVAVVSDLLRGLWTDQLRPLRPWTAWALLLVVVAVPVAIFLLHEVTAGLAHRPILGPDPGSIFARMGAAASYTVPIVMTAMALVGYAIRERSSAFALAGGVVFNIAATVAYLLASHQASLPFDLVQWIRLAQLNAAVAACYALAWLSTLGRAGDSARRAEAFAGDSLLNVQAALVPMLTVLPLIAAWLSLFWAPTQALPAELADAWAFASLALACAVVGYATWIAGGRSSIFGISAVAAVLPVFAAAIASRWDRGNWVAYNTLLFGHAVMGGVMLAIAWREKQGARVGADRLSAAGFVAQGTIVLALSLRELVDNQLWPAFGLGVLGVVLAPAAACIYQRRRYLYFAAAMVNGAGLLLADHARLISRPDEFVYFNAILLAAGVIPWLVIELRAIRPRAFAANINAPPAHRVAARGAVLLVAVTMAVRLYRDALGQPLPPCGAGLDWIALAVAAIAAGACLWDVAAQDSVALLYVLGLAGCGMLLDAAQMPPQRLLWVGATVTAACSLATSYLWSRREGLLVLADRLFIPRAAPEKFAGLDWLVPCNLLLVVAVVAMTFFVEISETDLSLRLLAAAATLTQTFSVALLARGDRRGVLQSIALQVGAVGAVMAGLATLEVGSTLTLLHALVVVAAALVVVAVVYGFVLGKLLRETSDWLAPARDLTPWLAALGAAALVTVLGDEIGQFARDGAVHIAATAIVVVAITLLALCLATLAAAVLPGRDPLGLSERGRSWYVYGAEIILAMLFLHLRLTMPWLFGGWVQQYWPLVVMAIAFAGVAVAELLRRKENHALARPLENTGALLPVLPVLGYWTLQSQVHYSLLLVLVGLLYGGLSIARRSFGFGILAAVAANGGLWYFLNGRSGWEFLAHPQVWLIPPALCLLAAAYLNRRQLSETQMTAIRYFSSMAIYLSSTGDIFLNGVAENPQLPVVLAVLSVLGILGGMLLRVRAFLFLGTGFLVLALFAIVWHAAVDLEQTWIWWVSGIVLGLLIVALFGLFEKKRQDVLDMVAKLKQWEG